MSIKGYLAIFSSLLLLTGVTVATSHVDLGTTANLVLALAIATTKAGLVALFFMHLRDDHKFHALILLSAVVFLAIFVGFTMLDTETRGRFDPIERAPHIRPPS